MFEKGPRELFPLDMLSLNTDMLIGVTIVPHAGRELLSSSGPYGNRFYCPLCHQNILLKKPSSTRCCIPDVY